MLTKKTLYSILECHWNWFQRMLIVLVLSGTIGFSSTLQANTHLHEIKVLHENGASSLALRLINKHQQIYLKQPDKWMDWERQRINIYQDNESWLEISTRVKNYNNDIVLNSEFVSWSYTQAAKALLKLSKASDSRAVLLNLISSTKSSENTEQLKWIETWRRLVIESYVTDSMIQDAQIAVLAFKEDYGEQSLEDRLLQARIMILNNEPSKAMQIIASDTKQPQAGMLYLLAQLRSKSRAPQRVQQAALRHMRGDWVDEELESQLWAVVAEAAGVSGDLASAARAMERALVSYQSDMHNSKLFKISSDRLWQVYIEHASKIAIRHSLKQGEDQPWLDSAKGAEQFSQIRARSLYVYIMLYGQDEKNRVAAARNFIRLLDYKKYGRQLIYRLFVDSNHFEQLDTIPELVRRVLIDHAVAISNYEHASKLMATITEPPEGTGNSYMWQLRRARILILGGNAEQGSIALLALIKNEQIKDQEKIKNLLQVIFDLQQVKEHELAFQLLEKTLSLNKTHRHQREVMYLMADSRKAQLRFDEAAHLYLKSAMIPKPSTMDDWAQTARYQAAGSLVNAGLTSDARGLYQQLLSVTETPLKRAVILEEIQKLTNNRTFIRGNY